MGPLESAGHNGPPETTRSMGNQRPTDPNHQTHPVPTDPKDKRTRPIMFIRTPRDSKSPQGHGQGPERKGAREREKKKREKEKERERELDVDPKAPLPPPEFASRGANPILPIIQARQGPIPGSFHGECATTPPRDKGKRDRPKSSMRICREAELTLSARMKIQKGEGVRNFLDKSYSRTKGELDKQGERQYRVTDKKNYNPTREKNPNSINMTHTICIVDE